MNVNGVGFNGPIFSVQLCSGDEADFLFQNFFLENCHIKGKLFKSVLLFNSLFNSPNFCSVPGPRPRHPRSSWTRKREQI